MTKLIPTGKLARSGVAGAALLKAGSQRLSHAAKRPFLSLAEREQQTLDLDEETAKLLFDTFSKLRGTALKIAQMLSMETSILPESFREELSKSYHQAPALGRPLVRKVMQQEFGQPAEAVFSSFNSKAYAAASLGQVHAATNEQGDQLAVKIQYPGIDITIKNDMQLVRSIVKRTRYSQLINSSLDEIEARLSEEVDYLLEANNTEWFNQNLKLPQVQIPQVYRQFSSARVLTTSKIDGLHLEEWLQTNPSQQQRNHFAQLLYDTFAQSFYGLGVLHADPNPGNYLFTDAGNLGLIDFGCIRHFSRDFVDAIPRLLRAYQDDEAGNVLSIYERLGIVGDMSDLELKEFYAKTLKPLGQWLTEPFRVEAFDFSDHKASYAAGGWKNLSELSKVKSISEQANEFVFFDRTFFGMYQIFERMGATVRMNHQWLI